MVRGHASIKGLSGGNVWFQMYATYVNLTDCYIQASVRHGDEGNNLLKGYLTDEQFDVLALKKSKLQGQI